MYRLFYNYKTIGDVLIIIFDNKEQDCLEKHDNIFVIKKQNKIIGINIFKISEIIKIKANGIIVAPPKELIDIINHMLKNNGVDVFLDYQESGFVCGEISKIDGKMLYVSTISDVYELKYDNADSLAIGEKVVILKPGFITSSGNLNIKPKLATYKDVTSGDDDSMIEVNEEYSNSSDYFGGF